MKRDVIVIGGGAAGIVAAITAARKGANVTILEHKDKIGKKILATGNGKCNYSNKYQSIDCYRSENLPFVKEVFSHFNAQKTVEFFKELGIYPKDRNGYLYPNSEQASSIVDVLQMELKRLHVEVLCNEEVKKIEPIIEANEKMYEVETIINDSTLKDSKANVQVSGDQKPQRKKYNAKRVIIATGGKASSKLGSDGSGYYFLQKLGHTIIPVVPALVQLKAKGDLFELVSGVRCDVALEILIDGEKIASEQGELQLTNYGISGIPVFQISRYAAKALLNEQKVIVNIDFMPQLSRNEVIELITKRMNEGPDKTPEQILIGLFNQKLIQMFLIELTEKLKKQGVNKDFGCAPLNKLKNHGNKKANKKSCSNIQEVTTTNKLIVTKKLFDKDTMELLTDLIKSYSVVITDTNSFDNAQVCAGGVDTTQIDGSTLESKINKGIYVVGEVLDVDGICGGYNLQWAWSTGYIAGEAAASKLQ